MNFSSLEKYYLEENIAMTTSDPELYPYCELVPCCTLPILETQQCAYCLSTWCLAHHGDLKCDDISSCFAVQRETNDWNPGYIDGGKYVAESASQMLMHDNFDFASPNMYHLESARTVQLPAFGSRHSPWLGDNSDECAEYNLQPSDKVLSRSGNQRPTGSTTPDASSPVRQIPRRRRREKGNRRYVKYLRESARKERSRQFATMDTVKAYCARRDLLFKVIQCEAENKWLESFLPVTSSVEY